MKCKAKVLKTTQTKDGIFITCQVNTRFPKEGTYVTIKWGKVRSLSQNNLYWQFLTWLVNDAGLKNSGYISAEELHEALKGHFLARTNISKGGIKIIEVGSTSDLNATDFMEYIEKIDKLINEFFGISTHPFWEEYHEYYGVGA